MLCFKSQWAKNIDYSTVVERTYRDDIVNIPVKKFLKTAFL